MDDWYWIAGAIVYALICVGVFHLLGEISGSADMATWKEVLWSATWPLIPLWLYLN